MGSDNQPVNNLIIVQLIIKLYSSHSVVTVFSDITQSTKSITEIYYHLKAASKRDQSGPPRTVNVNHSGPAVNIITTGSIWVPQC